jgi:prepilin-type N-terminal cleavage/methylation domain-containing protein
MAKKPQTRKGIMHQAFTLLEVLISIALLGIMLPALFSVVDMLKDSNDHLLTHLEKAKKVTKATKVLYMDILSSDGEISIKTEEQSRLCMNETKNSLYGLPVAKVCWVVMKEKNTLARIEGGYFSLPLKSEDRVEVDLVMQGVEIFDVYHKKEKIQVLLKEKNKDPISFLVQGVINPVLKVLANGTKMMRDGRKIFIDGTIIYKDGSKLLPDGIFVPSANKVKLKTKQNKNNKTSSRP